MSCKRVWLLVLISVSAIICALPVKADDVDRILGEDGLPITLDQISKYGAKKVYQGIWKAINDSSTSDFVKTKEWKDFREKPPIEMINDKDVIRAAAILFAKTGDTDGSKYSRDVGEIVGAEKRAVIAVERKGKIGYLRVGQFPLLKASSEIKFSLLSMPDISALVLDLRDNNGGYLTECLDVAGLFCKEPVSIKTKALNGQIDVNTRKSNAIFVKPVMVLVNKDTSDGAEMLANILREQRHAKLVGTKTRGYVTIRAITRADLGYKVAVKIAEAVHADSSPIEGIGLAPDLVVENIPWWHQSNQKIEKPSSSKIFSDTAVKTAIEELNNESN